MGKRFFRDQESAGAPRKRPRVVHDAPTSEEIHTSRQLQQLLAFSQDPARARHGLQSFKLFLDELLSPDSTNADRSKILTAYLEAAKPSTDEESPVFLPGIMQTWSYAGQTNHDNVMSAVPVVLALLMKLLSQSLDTVQYGLGICRTLLQKRQQELIARNLAADKGKAFIISPTLRMLREAVSFDGGAIARPLFRARASTFKSLARNMGIVHMGDEAEDLKRPSTRTNAVLFFLSALKFLHPEAKKELLFQRDVVDALTRDVKQDPPYLVREILNGLRSNALLDEKLPREAKAKLLSASTLTRLSSLYYYRLDASAESEPSVADVVHEFLILACTNPACGVLRLDSGYYPREADADAAVSNTSTNDQGLEAIVRTNKFKDEMPIRNYTLANFLPNLRPWSNVKQSELITSIFGVASELVANYFQTNKSFGFEPKLSATWIGYAAFLFNTVTLPIPDNLCRAPNFRELPPPTSVVIDNILPAPLSQKALSRSLANKSNLISFFATRILVAAIEKLDAAVRLCLDSRHANKGIWAEAARRLVNEFCQRSPAIKDMVAAYRSIPEGDLLHREAASRLQRLCYEVLPQVALTSSFDVSPFLETALARLSKRELNDSRDFALSLKELENLLAIAGCSPGMGWFAVSEGLSLSPFTMLLKVCVDAPRGVGLDSIRQVLNSVAVEQQLVPADGKHPGLLVLLEALQDLHESSPDSAASLWPFLDNCLIRCANAPAKYAEEKREALRREGISEAFVSPLSLAISEQLPFEAAKEEGQATVKALGRFLPKMLGLSVTAGESKEVLSVLFSRMAKHLKDSTGKLAKVGVLEGLQFRHNPWPPAPETNKLGKKANPVTPRGKNESRPVMDAEALEDTLHVPDGLAADNSALVKWSAKTVDELVDDGHLASLVALLVSEHASIRKEALVNILKAAAKFKQSEYEEKEQIWLLLSELAETARDSIHDGPLPSPIVAFAYHALDVLRDPLSSLYPRVNAFLTRGPVWSLDRLPLADEMLSDEPDVGDSYYKQTSWLLGYLLEGLRTPRDLHLFHRQRARGPIFQRVLALAANPLMRLPLRTQVLRMLYRATCIEGGSMTLMTRFDVAGWLGARLGGCADAEEAVVCEGLRKRIWDTCDQDKLAGWSRKALGKA